MKHHGQILLSQTILPNIKIGSKIPIDHNKLTLIERCPKTPQHPMAAVTKTGGADLEREQERNPGRERERERKPNSHTLLPAAIWEKLRMAALERRK